MSSRVWRGEDQLGPLSEWERRQLTALTREMRARMTENNMFREVLGVRKD